MEKQQDAKTADSDMLSGDCPQYDKTAKKFLSKRRLLARILHHLVPEFRHIGWKEIEETCIVDEPRINVPVNPGETNHAFPSEIRGVAQEQSDDAEGTICFDVVFYAKLPQNGKVIKFLINLEAQKEIPDKYPLMKRVQFYGSRLVSSQKGRDFEKSDYGSICKVYTIWLCFKTPEGYGSSINLYRPHEEHIFGDYEENPDDYQLNNAIVAYIGDQYTENTLLNLLHLIFKQNLSGAEKRKLLEQEYDMKLTDDMGEELNTMCNLSEGIAERATEIATENEQKNTILRLFRKGKKIADMMDATDWTAERIQNFLRAQNLQPAQ